MVNFTEIMKRIERIEMLQNIIKDEAGLLKADLSAVAADGSLSGEDRTDINKALENRERRRLGINKKNS